MNILRPATKCQSFLWDFSKDGGDAGVSIRTGLNIPSGVFVQGFGMEVVENCNALGADSNLVFKIGNATTDDLYVNTYANYANLIAGVDNISYRSMDLGTVISGVKNLSAAQLQTGQSAPVRSIPPPGAGRGLDIMRVVTQFTAGAVAFNPGDDVIYSIDTANGEVFTTTAILTVLANVFGPAVPSFSGSGSLAIVLNKGMLISTDADSVLGDGTLKAFYQFRIIGTNVSRISDGSEILFKIDTANAVPDGFTSGKIKFHLYYTEVNV